MTTKLEDALAALKAEHSDEPTMVQLIDLIVAQNERIKNLEHFSLEAKHRHAVVEKIQEEHSASIDSLAKTRDEQVSKVHAIETRPAQDTKRLDELDKRVTTVEGAVGSKAYKRTDTPTNGALNPFKAAIEPGLPPKIESQPASMTQA